MFRSKYRSQWTEYNGIKYASKREAKHAADLDLLKRAGEVIAWRRQVSIPLVVNGVKITCYVIDFEVQYQNARMEYHEVKGYPTDVFKIKLALCRALYPGMDIKIIK